MVLKDTALNDENLTGLSSFKSKFNSQASIFIFKH